MPEPAQPDAETRNQLLAVLGEFVTKAGASSLLLPPVAPGAGSFPEPWAPTCAGMQLLLRRLLWHASIDRAVDVIDRRHGAPPTERKPATRVELVDVDRDRARFALGFVGEDDIVGTVAHEVGTLFATLHRPDDNDPYRTAQPPVLVVDHDTDPTRGGVATVYLGLGVLAANAAYQQYSRGGKAIGGYVPLEYDVVRAGAIPMSALAFLLAVQAVVRGEDAPPKGLGGPQRDEASDWIKALRPGREALRERLGVPTSADAPTSRPTAVLFENELPRIEEPAAPKNAFRWQTHRGGVGFLAGAAIGLGCSIALHTNLAPLVVIGGATAGHIVGRRVRTPRCSACATIVARGATSCRKCGATLRGDIYSLSERLEAEERLEPDA